MRHLVVLFGFAAILVLSLVGSHSATAATAPTMTFSYKVIGDEFPPPAVLIYTHGGRLLSANLSATPTPYFMDAGSQWFVSNPLPGSNATFRWEIANSSSGPAVQGKHVTFVYYRQCLVTFAVYNAGNTHSFLLPHINYTSLGNRTSILPAQAVWADYLSPYVYANVTQAPPLSRWYGTGTRGVINVPTTIRPVYIQQYQLTFALSSAGPDSLQSAVLNGVFGGHRVNQTVTAPDAVRWLDFNSQFSLQHTIYPATGSYRWVLHSVSVTAATEGGNVNVTYFEQFPLSVSFTVSNGVSPSGPVVTSDSNGQQNSLQSYLGAPPTWADAGSTYSVSNLLQGSTSTERWITPASTAGVVTGPTTLDIDYFHQVRIGVSYSIVGGGEVSPTNAFYEYFGNQTLAPFSTTQTILWADVGTTMTVQGTFTGQSPLERWELGSFPSIPILAPQNISLVYYHQTDLQISYSIPAGGVPIPPVLAGSALGSPFTSSVLPGTTVWLDRGTSWSLSEFLQSGVQGERWAAAGAENGTVGDQASLSVAYIHEYFVALGANSQAGGSVSQSEWVPLGQNMQISATPATGWVFAGWLGNGPGSYVGHNATSSVSVQGPIQETAKFYLRFIASAAGGGDVQVSFGPYSYSVGGNPLTFYVAPGTNVTLVARPGPFETFTGWHGISAGTAGAVAMVATTPVTITASFAVNQVLAYGVVVLYWGAAVFVIFYLLRNRGISPRRPRGLGRLVTRDV
jgi:hypothetical protein